MDTLTLRECENGVTDEQLNPFVSGDTDKDRKVSRDKLRESIAGRVRYLDSVDPATRLAELDRPILTTADDEAEGDTEDDSVPPPPLV